jgi:hypothetical protein
MRQRTIRVALVAILVLVGASAPSTSLAAGSSDASRGDWGASLAFHLGLGGEFDHDGETSDASPTLGVTPVLERMFGANFALGFEWMFLWIRDADRGGSRSKLWSPHLRGRIAFPIWEKLEVGALLGVGPGLLWAQKNDGGFNLCLPSYRFAFGASYPINPKVRIFGDLGYLGISYTGEVEPNSKEVDATFGTVLMTVGLTAEF